MWVEPEPELIVPRLRKSQEKAIREKNPDLEGPLQRKDAVEHFALGHTTLPLPDGEAKAYYCEVTEDSPSRCITIGGVTFVNDLTKPHKPSKHARLRYVTKRNKQILTDNQVEFIKLKAAAEVVEGYHPETGKWTEGVAADYIVFELAEPIENPKVIAEKDARIEKLQREIEELKKLVPGTNKSQSK